jgi:hypothetical protein
MPIKWVGFYCFHFCLTLFGSTLRPNILILRNTGSIATVVQSGIGNVAAGSLFATCQSAGAGGAGLAVINGAVQVGGGVLTALGGGLMAKSKL